MAQQYLTRTEFFDLIIPADALEGLSNTQVDSVLVWASGLAAGYVAKRYKLPLITWGEELKLNVGKLAQYELFKRHGFRPGSGNDQTSKDSHDEAMDWLRDISKGLTELACVDSTPTLEEDGPLSASDTPMSFRFTTGTGRGGCCDDE